MKPSSRLLVLVALATLAEAGDDLSDFTNNLAQDLGPLLALFGETVTKQYLSESTTYLDYFIFGMGPLGIITAVVSVIRVCGHPSLRAFIGRSKEGEAAVEAELCPSTSRDVCELFHKGGIARVLGRLDILELVCISKEGSSDDASESTTNAGEQRNQRPNSATSEKGISEEVNESRVSSIESRHKRKRLVSFKKYLTAQEDNSPVWKRTRSSVFSPRDALDQNKIFTAPNLTLNIGIKRPTLWVLFVVALMGLVLQSGVVVLAGFGAWRLGWKQDDTSSGNSKDYAPRMFIAGTLMLCLGMWGCAALIGQATQEVRYERRRDVPHGSTRLIWLQPGPQRVGDQSFDACSYFESEKDPLASWVSSRKRKGSEKVFELLTYAVVFSSVVGYVLQFIGLRGMKAWVSLAQLGLTLFMSLLRGSLRMQRVQMKQNRLSKMPDLVAGHELDWLAFELAFDKSPMQAMGQPQKGTSWHVSSRNPGKNERNTSIYEATRQQDRAGSISSGAISYSNETLKTFVLSPECRDLCHDLFEIRVQLSQITGNPETPPLWSGTIWEQQWTEDVVKVRDYAGRLANAIEQVATVLLEETENRPGMTRTIPVDAIACVDSDMLACALPQTVGVELLATGSRQRTWQANSAHIEAILGLWAWSILSSRNSLREDEYGNTVTSATHGPPQILSIGLDDDLWSRDVDFEVELGFWLGPDAHELLTLKRQLRKDLPCGLFTAPLHREGVRSKTPMTGQEMNSVIYNERLFGWNLLNEVLDLGEVDPIGKSMLLETRYEVEDHVPIKIQHLRKSRSLLELCTQHLFATLVKEMTRLSNFNIPRSTVSENEGLIQFQNTFVHTVEKPFVENGLGARADVVTTVVSQFRKPLTPDDESVISSITKRANDFRIKEQAPRAELLLRWGCQHFAPEFPADIQTDLTSRYDLFEKILTTTLEFYRWCAASEPRGEQMQFAKNGLKWIAELCKAMSKDVEGAAHEPFLKRIDTKKRCYEDVIERLNATQNELKIHGQVHPLIQALQDKNKSETLYRLSLLKVGDTRSKTLKPALPLAMRNQWTEVVDALFELKAHPDDVDEAGRTAASYCAELGHTSFLKQLTDRGAFLDMSDDQLRTPLHWAAVSGQSEMATLLLEYGGVDASRLDIHHIPPLWHAIYKNKPDVVRVILDRGFNAKFQNELERDRRVSPLYYAAQHGQISILQILLNHDVEINKKDTRFELTPLHIATENNHDDVVRMLLAAGAKVDVTQKDKEAPLHFACNVGNLSIVQQLLKAGADANQRDFDHQTPLHHAAKKGHDHVIDVMVEAGADIMSMARYHSTLLETAAKTERWFKTSSFIDKLLKLGAPVNGEDSIGRTPLYYAAEWGNNNRVKTLLSYGANPNHITAAGNTPLVEAAARDFVDTIRLLVEAGADVNLPDGKGMTALAATAKNGKFESLQALLELGASKMDLKSAREGIRRAEKDKNIDVMRCLENWVSENEDDEHIVEPSTELQG